MNAGVSQESVESGLEAAFGLEPEKPKAVAPQPQAVETEEAPEVETDFAEGDDAEPLEADGDEQEGAAEPVAEPEFEIEVSGQRITIKGQDQVKELLQKGVDYSQKTEHFARAQEAFVARAQIVQMQEQFSRLITSDLAELQAIDSHLDAFNKIDWANAYDTDPFNALKLREQRDQLREQRTAKWGELQQKQQAFQQGQANAASQLLASEYAALESKVPEWRNGEKARAEKGEIARLLVERYGYSPSEINNIMDHRILLAARDLLSYHKLQTGRDAKAKQVRSAPPVVKPGVAQQKPNGKTQFTKVRQHLRQLGSKGNHKAQEALVTEMLTKAYK